MRKQFQLTHQKGKDHLGERRRLEVKGSCHCA